MYEWYIFLHLPYKSTIHVGKYTSPMDPMGKGFDHGHQMRFKDCDSWCAYDFEKPDTIAGNTWGNWRGFSRDLLRVKVSHERREKHANKNRLVDL